MLSIKKRYLIFLFILTISIISMMLIEKNTFFFSIDTCLDKGGMWNDKHHYCIEKLS